MLRCLVVDDDALGRELAAHYMEGIAACEMAADGREAIEKFRAALDSGTSFHLVLLDLIMPGMDGYETGKAIRKLEHERGIPVAKGVNIIVISALNTPGEIINAYISAQSAAHLVKPIEPENLMKTLKKLGLIGNGGA
ncbi:MAG: response regulator [Deltaproteobacteria bacterium]|nr:response regulator [Deltaproteobacteria bacterium]